MAEHSHAPPRIHVVHATSPACAWSWGYEAVLQRLRMVYGDQISLTLRLGTPYEDREQWLVDYGMSAEEATEWVNKELPEIMDVPLAPIRWESQPQSCMPATLAVTAARRQDEELAWKYNRALVRRFAIEGKDPTREEEIVAAAKEVGLDVARLKADLAKPEELREEYEQQGSRGPPVHVGFYNVVVWDGGSRRVVLDYAFDPETVEGAIDYLSGGKLRKSMPTRDGILPYLREHGLAPLSEIGRVFSLDARGATEELEKLEKAGKIERVTLSGAPHWRPIP